MTIREFVKRNRITILNQRAFLRLDVMGCGSGLTVNDNYEYYKSTLKMKGRRLTVCFAKRTDLPGGPTAEEALKCLAADKDGNSMLQEFLGDEYTVLLKHIKRSLADKLNP